MGRSVLVTGAAGYIGSHMCHVLAHAGHEPVGLDDLSTGFREAIMPDMAFYEACAGDQARVQGIIETHGIRDVIHFAGRIINSESIINPALYYTQNTFETLKFMEACGQAGVERVLYSSSAGVYGDHGAEALRESIEDLRPLTPYGASKLFAERIIADLANTYTYRYVNLRYFNVAGAGLAFGIGQRAHVSTHIIKVLCEALTGQRDQVDIFGTDYPTPDGSCVRDYAHVLDLAEAHLAALDFLTRGGKSGAMNCGYGHGFSVREVIAAAFEVAGRQVRVVESPRRPGDPAVLVASNDLICAQTQWRPRRDDLKAMIESALLWEERMRDPHQLASSLSAKSASG